MEAADVQGPGTADEQVLSIDFSRYLRALRKYAWLIASLVVLSIAGAVVYTLRVTPIYEASASVQIEPRLPDLLGTGDLFNVAAGNNTAEYYKQQLKVLSSFTVSKLTVQQADLAPKLLTAVEQKTLSHDDQLDLATTRLQSMLAIKYPDPNRIMYVYVRNSDAKLAMDIANAHIATYVSYAKGLLTSNSNQASAALEAEFTEAETKLRAIEDKIYKFQADNDMIALTLEEHQTLVSSNILAFTTKLNDAKADEIKLGAKLNEMRKEAKQEVVSSPILMMTDNNASFEALRTQYFTEYIHLLELQKDLGVKNSDYLAQKQKVDVLYKALEGEVNIIVSGTTDQYTAALKASEGLAAEVEKYKQEAKLLSPKIVQYQQYQREKKDVEDRYNILRARLSATQMTNGMSSAISNVHPLDPALLPTKPVSPNMRINVTVAGLLGLVIGIGIAVLLVFLDRSIKSTADATTAAGTPVLGIIPMLGDDVSKDDRSRDMYVHEHPTSHVAECCRLLRTNIMFSAADHPLKMIVVCSANAREGKTTTVIYLGTTMAQSGQRVLLIDTDMRRPRLHASTGVSRAKGLSNLILGEEDYDSVIQPTEVPGMFVLPCGPLPPNPAELLMTDRFAHVLGELGKRFDRIILDSPPLQAVTDAVVLAKRADGVILVARAGSTVRDELKRSARMIRDVGAAIFGVIVNEFDRDARGGGYYYYSYYGYGTDGDGKPPKRERPAAN